MKSPAEVVLLRRSVDTADVALRRVLSVLKPGVMEYELEAELAGDFLRGVLPRADDRLVGHSGPACVLH